MVNPVVNIPTPYCAPRVRLVALRTRSHEPPSNATLELTGVSVGTVSGHPPTAAVQTSAAKRSRPLGLTLTSQTPDLSGQSGNSTAFSLSKSR